MSQKRIRWTLELIHNGLKKFYTEYGRYPSATEFDEFPYLPRTKTIERRFGGLVALRKQLKLEGEHDLRTGAYSTNRAQVINKRAHILEQEVYELLTARFGKEFVHREYFFTDDHRTRADFYVYDSEGGFCVDVFYPGSLRNLAGCLNIKLIKYANTKTLLPYPVIFLQMNEDLQQADLDALIKKKKRGLDKDQHLMSWDVFKSFTTTRKGLRLMDKGKVGTK